MTAPRYFRLGSADGPHHVAGDQFFEYLLQLVVTAKSMSRFVTQVHDSKWLDLVMLVRAGGRESTEHAYAHRHRMTDGAAWKFSR